jgi:hypothetical protein
MRIQAWTSCLALVVACTSTDRDSVETAGGATDTAMAQPAGAATADLAGTWSMTSRPTSGTDTTTARFTITATSSTAGWTLSFPGRDDPVPARVSMQGDSVLVEAGPVPSMLRQNVQVVTRTVVRREGDRLVGTTQNRYTGAGVGADSVVTLRTEGTRAP